MECPCIPKGRAGKGKARPAAWRGRDNRVEGVNLGGNRAPARGRNRNSRPEPTPSVALAGFPGPAGMAGGSTEFGDCQGWGERASARRSPALSIAQSDTGTLPGSQDFDLEHRSLHRPFLLLQVRSSRCALARKATRNRTYDASLTSDPSSATVNPKLNMSIALCPKQKATPCI